MGLEEEIARRRVQFGELWRWAYERASEVEGQPVNPHETLQCLREVLRQAAADDREYVLFGSVVLWLHGLREEIGDVDVFVSRRVWGRLFGSGWVEMRVPRADDPPFLERASLEPPLHFFYDWVARDKWMDVRRCFASAETVAGWRCLSLDELRRQKRLAYAANVGNPEHEKHLRDLAVLEERLG